MVKLTKHKLKKGAQLKILYIANELNPYINISAAGEIIQKLANSIKNKDKSIELRVIMPKYDIISDRKYHLHNVIRFSNLKVDLVDNLYDFISVKVSSIPDMNKTQVYFLENEKFFQKKNNNNSYPNQNDCAIFFAKGALVLAKELDWFPDIIHCHDWHTGLIPFFLKKNNDFKKIMKKNSKVIFTIYNKKANIYFEKEKLKHIDEKNILEKSLTKNLDISTSTLFTNVGGYYANNTTLRQEIKDIDSVPENITCIKDEDMADYYYNLYKKK